MMCEMSIDQNKTNSYDISSRVFLVTSTDKAIRSNGNSALLAAVCMTAVKKACGLKNPPSHTEGGV